MKSEDFKIAKFSIFKYLAISTIAVFFQILMSNQVKLIIDYSAENKKMNEIFYSFLVAIFSIVMYQVIMILKNKVANNIVKERIIGIKCNLFQSFFHNNKKQKSEFISIFCNDLPLIEEKYYSSILNRIEMFSVICMVSFALIYINILVFFSVIILTAINLVVNMLSENHITQNMSELSKLYDDEMKIMDNYFDSYTTTKSLSAENLISNAYKKICIALECHKYKYLYRINVLSNIYEGMSFLDIIIITLLCSYFISKEIITLGDLLSITILANMFFGSVPIFLISSLSINSTKDIRNKIKLLLRKTDENKQNIKEVSSIEISNLKVSFDGNPIFENYSVDFEKSDKICIIGKNGSGKSTFVNCICDLQEYEGKIYFNKEDIKNINIFNNLCYISQKPFVFSESLDFNIFLGNTSKHTENFKELLEILDFEKFYELRKNETISLDDTIISGGEKQKLALLRALLHKPDIVILDEALSMIDVASRLRILNYMIKQKFILIHITHNTEDIKVFNKILDFDKVKLNKNK